MYQLTFRVLPVEKESVCFQDVTQILEKEVESEKIIIGISFKEHLYHEHSFKTPLITDLEKALLYLQKLQSKMKGFYIKIDFLKYVQSLFDNKYPFQSDKEEVVLSMLSNNDTYKNIRWNTSAFYYEEGLGHLPVEGAVGTLWFMLLFHHSTPLDDVKKEDIHHIIQILNERHL